MAEEELSSATRTSMREVSAHILEQAELMSSSIEEVLDIQRVLLGKLPLEIRHLDLAELARSAADEVARATRGTRST
jgi:signal transduction histidine kinase